MRIHFQYRWFLDIRNIVWDNIQYAFLKPYKFIYLLAYLNTSK